MRSLNSFSFIFPNVWMQSSLARRLSLTWWYSMDQNKNNVRVKQKKNTKCQNSPANVIHGIKKDNGAISRVHDNTVNRDVPILVQRVMLVNMPPPSYQPMIPRPHIEQFVRKVNKVGDFLENGIELVIGLMSYWTPRGSDVVRDMEDFIEVIVWRNVHSPVTITINLHKLIFQTSDINVVDGSNKRKTSQSA